MKKFFESQIEDYPTRFLIIILTLSIESARILVDGNLVATFGAKDYTNTIYAI